MESTMDVKFVVDSTIGGVVTKEFAGTVNARDSKEIEILVPHGSEWSLEWEASDPKDSGTRTERVGLPVNGSETANCPPDDVFDPDVSVAELVCKEPPPHVVPVTLDNSKSTVDADFRVISTIDGADNTEFDGTVEAGKFDLIDISVPEDATWAVFSEVSESGESFNSQHEHREPPFGPDNTERLSLIHI